MDTEQVRFFARVIVPLLLLTSVHSGMAAPPSPTVTRNKAIVAASDAAGSIFSVRADGSILHRPSGAVCPSDFEYMHLADIQIYPATTPGDDIGCDYGRVGPDGYFASKLTIFIVRVPDGTTLDSVYEKYRNEVLATPSAVEGPASLHIADEKTGSDDSSYRASGFSITLDGRRYHSELLVSLRGEWAIEVRATYPNAVIVVDKNATQESLRAQLDDIKDPYLAFMAVNDSLTNVKYR